MFFICLLLGYPQGSNCKQARTEYKAHDNTIRLDCILMLRNIYLVGK